jgi:hypothetical protein
VSEDIPNNVETYQPETGSWWINVRADNDSLGNFITPLNFKVSNDKSQITVRKFGGQLIFGPAGEGVAPVSGVGNDEVWKLEETPTASTTPNSTYNDGKSSTYGAPNIWGGGLSEQDLSTLRSVVPSTPLTSVVINEVLTHTDLPDKDSIELYNTTSSPVDISGWFLSDDGLDYGKTNPEEGLTKYAIPASTIIPAHGYMVFTEDDFNAGPNPFLLSSTGDEVFLSEGNGSTMTGARNFIRFGAIENGVSWGRSPNATGNIYRMKSKTLGALNSAHDGSPVVLNELMYNAQGPPTGTLILNELEYIELKNNTSSPVDLVEDFGAGGVFPWQLAFGVEFDFCDVDMSGKCLASTEITIGADDYLLVVSFDPAVETTKQADFRTHYGLDGSVQIVGPYSFGLNDFTDTVQLVKPDSPDPLLPPMVLYDGLKYFDFRDWPTEPDGGGPSLERRNPLGLGDLASNWEASVAAKGTPGAANSVQVAVPALGSWGLMLMTLLLAGSGVIASGRRARRGLRI